MVRRILKPFTVEIRGAERRKAAAPMLINQEQPRIEWPVAMIEAFHEMPQPVPAPAADQAPRGRILPVIEQPSPVIVTAPVLVKTEVETPLSPIPLERIALVEPRRTAVVEKVAAETPPLVPRTGRPRKPRAEFDRSERWKARLPAAVHRSRKRPKRNAE